jgi:hypothetical protein
MPIQPDHVNIRVKFGWLFFFEARFNLFQDYLPFSNFLKKKLPKNTKNMWLDETSDTTGNLY